MLFRSVTVHLETKLSEIGEKSVVIESAEGKQKLPADDIILAIGYNPAPAFESAKNVHIVGDAYAVGNLRTVVWRAWEIAESI